VTSRATLQVVLAMALLPGVAPSPSATAQEASPGGRVPPTPVDYDLRGIRNVFRYADQTPSGPDLRPSPSLRDEDEEEALEPASRVRLVGFVERLNGVVAALAVDGEVVLLAEGDSAAGFTVVELSEEAVVLRTPDGERLTLLLP
jgi:hypothetical protein